MGESDGWVAPHRIELAGTQNVRDLGGYPTGDGATTRHGRFVRAADMFALTQADMSALREYGITSVVDLRMQREIERLPNLFKSAGSRVAVVEHDFWGDRFDDYRSGKRGAPDAEKLAGLYCAGLEQSGFVMAGIMATFAQGTPGAFGFHCRSGKDRTGLVSAMLLGLAGVADDVICDDYAYSSVCLREPMEAGAKRPGEPGYYLTTCDAETMRLTLGFVDDQFGGVEGYLRHVGVSVDQIGAIRARLLD